MKFDLIMEQWNEFLLKEIYSDALHSFIQYAYELDVLRKERRISVEKKRRKLFDFLNNNNFKFLGGGIGRQAFMSPTGEIVKISYTAEADYASKKEISLFNRQDIAAFPRIEEYDQLDNLWFVVERATPIGRNEAKYEELFPKLSQLSEPVRTSSTRLYQTVLSLLIYYYLTKVGSVDDPKEELEIYTSSAFALPYNSHLLEPAKEIVQKYFEKPDRNFGALLKAILYGDVSPFDFHYNNLAYDENNNIKIIDAG